ncbi:uracil-DNA glycosylase [Nocardioides astragali]|uniref:Uracil-DNA glycosylase family protein n=1 Tax=Nocardioides astragali TaxID=1776736 RepID=A0ABW2N1M9_9ACTN|nr:uracil-DNA glycosylase family protein [Nocardioides astragali]
MADVKDATPWVPESGELDALQTAAHDCRGCELGEPATQVVFSAGDRSARIMLVGEQPGDQEDRQGEPFVGPAGRVLDEALAEAGVDRSAVLRLRGKDGYDEAFGALVDDLRLAAPYA